MKSLIDSPTKSTLSDRKSTKYILKRQRIERSKSIFTMKREEIIDRLLKHRFIRPDGHWGWNAKKDHGYARVKMGGKQYRVIRIICWLYHGLDLRDENQQANHKLECPDKECWKPECLYVGSHRDNQKDRTTALTHCKNGHLRSPANLYKYYNRKTKSFMTRCKICRRKIAS